ncbi:MAG: response regulator transcription factor [Arcobacter sp.]|uniref:response regulator transcription factor n=1 Tax=Arcobacter sp. TaxID=1872629 RepID=UPI003AFFC587
MSSNEKRNYSVLFVEDEDEIRLKYLKHIEKLFETVYEAKDGEEAYKIYLDKKPNIMIIDINLPKLNGIELLQKIRKKDYTTKAIMLTAYSSKEYLLSATELMLTKYLVKPITRIELKDALTLVIKELDKFDIIEKKTIYLKENYYWNLENNELYNAENQLVPLTQNETKISEILFNNINRTMTFDDIIFYVWEDSFNKDFESNLKTTIKNLRKKLPKDTIKNIFGIGYRVE